MRIKKNILKDDQKLVKLAKRDHKAFALIYDKYFEKIYGFIFKRVRDEAIAGDICQEAMLKAMLNIKKYENRGLPFTAWLYRIASNEVNLYFRQAKKMTIVPIHENELNQLWEEAKIDRSGRSPEELIPILNKLSIEQTELIDLRFFMGYSFKEIASLYNISEANAKMRLYRLLDQIKKQTESI